MAPAPAAPATFPATAGRLVDLEDELADLHGKAAALVFTSGWISNLAVISDDRFAAARLSDPVGRARTTIR